jgi:hypothetical protein
LVNKMQNLSREIEMKRIATLITVLATSAALTGCLFGKKEEAPAAAPVEAAPVAEAPAAMPADAAAPTEAAPADAGAPAAPAEQAPTGN